MSHRPTILCVDDQAANLQIRVLLLEQFGCNAITACDHQSTLRTVSENSVDLVVIDYHLANGETGEQIARDLRVIKPCLPLIMLTGDPSLPESAAASVDAVLVKGLGNARTLFDTIEELLPGHRLNPRHTMLFGTSHPPAVDEPEDKQEPDKAS